jgi:Holliday junction resolvasome RuvABC endonuclease subunit
MTNSTLTTANPDISTAVVGIDLGLHMGYAVVRSGTLIDSGVTCLGTKVSGPALVVLHDCLVHLVHDYSPTFVAYEQIFQHHKSATAARAFGAYEGILLLLCEQLAVKSVGYKVHDIKRYWTNKATATKDDMVDECLRRFKTLPEEDEADAIAVAHLCYSCEISGEL